MSTFDTAEQLRAHLDRLHVSALNELIHAVERLEVPALPDVPDWDKSPASIECIGAETRTPEELIAIGLEWQVLAGKLHDLLVEATEPDAWGDFENVIKDLHDRADRAREAMITLGGYETPLPL